jgi:ERCC4-type nuclease
MTKPVVLIDTREQKRLFFPNHHTKIAKLKWGDYSKVRGKTKVSVELKRGGDWLRCWATEAERARVKKQFAEHTKNVERPWLVVVKPNYDDVTMFEKVTNGRFPETVRNVHANFIQASEDHPWAGAIMVDNELEAGLWVQRILEAKPSGAE